MDNLFLCIIVFLFLLAAFDLSVGVSNDAVNFLNSAQGSKAAPFRRIILVASVGVFLGAAMSNGMMDIARHGIFRPEYFSFYDLICIFMAVMVTDIILLDIFNSLGMPTSTTVSMVFELLGATFVVALVKMAGDSSLRFNDLLNTEKALSVILGIFLSVAIAFVSGTVVQFLSRIIFSFNYRSGLKWKIGIFGGTCATAIVYFLLFKGMQELTFMTPEVKGWIKDNAGLVLPCCFVFFTVLMQLLHLFKVNVLKAVVLMGTFALAMAFAGNDLVNFIGVPLSGLASFQDYVANGGGDARAFMMGSLNGPADTPIYFLIGAGAVMVVSLATSKKALNVSKTEIGLGSQQAGEEMFGSSVVARRLVGWTLTAICWTRDHTPRKVCGWFDSRFNREEMVMEQGAAFDLIRGSVNLVLAGVLIALGTSLRLPLSTTFVTFMVAMGTSLADRAWGRESAVFRVTGVISVIGGWFLTAGAAFIGTGIIVSVMYYGGYAVMLALSLFTMAIIVRSNRRFRARKAKSVNAPDLYEASVAAAAKCLWWWLRAIRLSFLRRNKMNSMRRKIFPLLLMLAAVPVSAQEKSPCIPDIHGIIRAKYEYEPPVGKGRFEIRNARVSMEGMIIPVVCYKAEIDLSDEGSVRMLDAYVRLRPGRGWNFTIGQMRVPFGIDVLRPPHLQYFANRSFIAKQVGDVRDVGAATGWSFGKSFPVTLEGGIFNGSGLAGQKDFWTSGYDFSFKVRTALRNKWNIALSMQKANAGDVNTYLYDGGTYFQTPRWHIEAEYLRKHYARSTFKAVNAVDAFAAYRLPSGKRAAAISFLARYDYMSDHSGGMPHDDGKPGTDDPERHRLTGGVTLHFGKKSFQADIRLNYEQYFYAGDATPAVSEQSKAVAEFVVRF